MDIHGAEGSAARSRLGLRPVRLAKGSQYCTFRMRQCTAMRWLNQVTFCSDIDMMSSNADGRFVHKDGTPDSEP